jgi:hypothetical protein
MIADRVLHGQAGAIARPEGRMNDRKQSEGLWAILFERLRQREVDGSRAIAQALKARGDR